MASSQRVLVWIYYLTRISIASAMSSAQDGAAHLGNTTRAARNASPRRTATSNGSKSTAELGGYDQTVKPRLIVDNHQEVFTLILRRAIDKCGLKSLISTGGSRLKVGTMCSGTDAPIFALRELQEAAMAEGYSQVIDFEHMFSAEIESFKQAFINRNTPPRGDIFRDVTELGHPNNLYA